MMTVVPSVCWTVTVSAVDPSALWTDSVLTVRCVEAAGEATMVVVVADEIAVLSRPGVTVVPFRST